MKNNNHSVLLSIFKRKGGEGFFTKIITENNKSNFINQLIGLEIEENPLFCFKESESNWILLTTKRLLGEQNGKNILIYISNLAEVSLAMKDELKDKVYNRENFTKLIVKDKSGTQSLIELEKGKPYHGFYQVLHYMI